MKSSLPIIELRAVDKCYDDGEQRMRVLSELYLSIAPGEMVVVRGASGSGKTTLLNLIGGLDRPSAGEITVDGNPLHRLSEHELTRFRAREAGFIFQFHNLIPTLTVEENVLTGIEAARPLVASDRARAVEVLGRVGLEAHRNRFPARLSGGQQQRVAVARALVKSPKILLADEPTGNLDEDSGRAVIDLVKQVQREIGATVVLVTHNPEIADRADRVVELRNGRIGAVRRAAEVDDVAT